MKIINYKSAKPNPERLVVFIRYFIELYQYYMFFYVVLQCKSNKVNI